MAIPGYQTLMLPLLKFASDKKWDNPVGRPEIHT